MSETIKVRVISEKGGFIYGRQRLEGQVFTLKPVEHSIDIDSKGEPVVISAEQQFSERWMERVDGIEKVEVVELEGPKVPSDMETKDLKKALKDAGIELPSPASRTALIRLLEDHQAEDEE